MVINIRQSIAVIARFVEEKPYLLNRHQPRQKTTTHGKMDWQVMFKNLLNFLALKAQPRPSRLC
jgi:hypothetical protein